MASVTCQNCGKENSERNYYCRYCGKQIKECFVSKRYGHRNPKFLNLECLSDSNEEVVHINGYTPYESKIVKKETDE